ncbi:MAG: hypothetical protein HKM88_00165, partial [Halobacteria archaeon]|nr:hypothetical protein [Halobacteria archaeon]
MSYRIPLLMSASLLLSPGAQAGVSPWACQATTDKHWDCLVGVPPGTVLLAEADVTTTDTAVTGPAQAGAADAAAGSSGQQPAARPVAIDERWRLCPPPVEPPFMVPVTAADSDDRIRMSADTAESSGADIHTLQGNAVV